MSVAKDKTVLLIMGQAKSAGFEKYSSGKDALNSNHTWEFSCSKIRGLD